MQCPFLNNYIYLFCLGQDDLRTELMIQGNFLSEFSSCLRGWQNWFPKNLVHKI